MNHNNVIITGAGPAGLFCALRCAESGLKVLLLEKNPSPGKKFLLSGSGQCNITHSGTVPDFTKHYGDHGNFVKPALNAFPPDALVSFLETNGIPVTERDDGKIFPESMRGSDILSMMVRLCRENGVEFKYGSEVKQAIHHNGGFTAATGTEKFTAESLVIATGGRSYPATGSTGDGYRFAESFGHTIIQPVPALAPVTIKNYRFSELPGISFRDREISLFRNGKKIRTANGDILFTPGGLSGPGILDISRYISGGDIIEFSLSGLNSGQMNSHFTAESRISGRTSIKNYLKKFDLPERVNAALLEQQQINPRKNISEISREERINLIESIGGYPFIIAGKGGFNIAMATAGGVSTAEIDRRTLESKIISRLYFTGEVLDIDGDTGGYNLQWAFSSAKAAADSICGK